MHTDAHCQVLITGGGLAGLATATFLGLRGVRAVVAERHPSTSIHPRARGQVPTTMEALRAAGVDQQMRDASPADRLSVVIAESLTGTEYFAHIAEDPLDFSRYSDAGSAMASQESAERILAARATELGADLRFSTEVSDISPDGTATLRHRDTGHVTKLTADYVVAADGHRGGTREALGIGRHGRGELSTAMSIVFEADLDSVLRDRGVLLYHMRGPLPGATFVTTDDPRRHNVHVGIGDGPWDADRCVAAVRIVTGIPDLDVNVLSYAPWDTAAWVADRFAAGQVFLAGDAARVAPPTGGMGGNSAILDGYSLAWKLAMVLSGQAGPGLLDSHDAERRAYAEEFVDQQYARMVERIAPQRADDAVPPVVDDTKALFGFRYPRGAFTPQHADGAGQYDNPDAPSFAPGTRLPLLPAPDDPRCYELSFRTANPDWARQAERTAAELGIDMNVRLAGADAAARAGLGAEGAVLVRPDRVIAWHTTIPPSANPFSAALRTVFDR